MWILRLMLLYTLPGSLEPLRSNPRNYEASLICEGAKSPLPTIAIFFCFAKFSFGTAYLWSWQLNGQSLVITARIFNETRCPLPSNAALERVLPLPSQVLVAIHMLLPNFDPVPKIKSISKIQNPSSSLPLPAARDQLPEQADPCGKKKHIRG